MLTIFVTNYWQLFTLRLLTGIALGGAVGCMEACSVTRLWSSISEGLLSLSIC